MKDRTIAWVFLAFVLGFAMPVCSCIGTGFLTLSALGNLAGESAPTMTGVGDAVAVIRLEGTITSSSSEDYFTLQGITPELVTDLLGQATATPDVKAVVVRVNSPGGSVVASDEIYRAFLEFDKPIVVWMGETAASGGYYIACGSDYVFAHPDTLTGSIGVISQFLNVEELMNKVGVDAVVITSGPSKDIGSPFREMTEEEQALWEGIIDEVYDGFVEIVAQQVRGGRIHKCEIPFGVQHVDPLGHVLDDAFVELLQAPQLLLGLHPDGNLLPGLGVQL